MFFLCPAFPMLLRLFIAALWSPAGKGLTSWLWLVMFIVFLLLSHVVSWVRCGTRLYRFLIFVSFLTLTGCCGHKRLKAIHSSTYCIHLYEQHMRFSRCKKHIQRKYISFPQNSKEKYKESVKLVNSSYE